ncbi:UNVERIFIED_CONTAM: hypothetical protein Scaly_2523200 [Sesamum calycinum]|uniref:Uncharacterized protein n=1 Tax=Sesamum calycinum TaxID=2727403 RepID=A0AAW2LVL0_9LAMI
MVTSWIWNSISKDILEAFMYASSSQELWLELQRRSVNLSTKESYNTNFAYLAVGKENRRGYNDKRIQKCRQFVDKRSLTCDHCHKSGHSKESCFKLFGVPEWYKNLPEQSKRSAGVKNFAAAVGTFPNTKGFNQPQNNAPNHDNLTTMMAEMLQLMKDKLCYWIH